MIVPSLENFWSKSKDLEFVSKLKSQTKNWAEETSRTLGCIVIVGCPGILDNCIRSAALGFENGKKFIRYYERQEYEAFERSKKRGQAIIGICK